MIESQRLTDWHRFGADAIGLHVDELTRDTLRFRLDDRECRLLIRRGPAEDVTVVGWEIDDHQTFDAVLGRVRAAGLPVIEGTPDEAALRGVERLWRFPGPKGVATEVFTRAHTTNSPLRMQNTAFVTGRSGMGHLAITTTRPEQLHTYWNNLLDLRRPTASQNGSDRRSCRSGSSAAGSGTTRSRSPTSRACASTRSAPQCSTSTSRSPGSTTCWRASTASPISGSPWPGRGPAHQRPGTVLLLRHPVRLRARGRLEPRRHHPRLEATWEPSHYQGISLWGHTVVGENVATVMSKFQAAVRSLREREETVPALSTTPKGAHR